MEKSMYTWITGSLSHPAEINTKLSINYTLVIFFFFLKEADLGASLAVQRLGLCTSTARRMGSTPAQRTKTPYARRHGQATEKGKENWKLFKGWFSRVIITRVSKFNTAWISDCHTIDTQETNRGLRVSRAPAAGLLLLLLHGGSVVFDSSRPHGL